MSRRAMISSLLVLMALWIGSQAWGQTLSFRDAGGNPAASYLEGTRAFVRLEDPGADASGFRDSATVELTTAIGGDLESLVLRETGPHTGIFTGSIGLSPGGGWQLGVLETAVDPGPPAVRDTLQASYLGVPGASAGLVGSSVRFLDDRGRPASAVVLGGWIRLQVEDRLRTDPFQREQLPVEIAVPASGDSETVWLLETGVDTRIFEAEVESGLAPSFPNLRIDAQPGDSVEVTAPEGDGFGFSSAQAVAVASTTELVDAKGEPAGFYLESSRVYVRVVSPFLNNPGFLDTASVTLTADLTGDQEVLQLTETGPFTGVFTGSLRLALDSGVPGNGRLETTQDAGPPHRFDTVRASHADPGPGSSDAVTTGGSLTRFVDAAGTEVSSYASGTTAFVAVEDWNFNDPLLTDTVVVSLQSLLTGDQETIEIRETGLDTGLFRGSLPLAPSFSWSPNDGSLQAGDGGTIEAMHVDRLGLIASGAQAAIDAAAIFVIDEEGRPTDEVLEGGTLRVRLISVEENQHPGIIDQVPVSVRSRGAGDFEEVLLTETGPDTGVFEGSIELVPTSVSSGDGVLTTDAPVPQGDEIAVSWGPFVATAFTVPVQISFLDRFGGATAEVPAGGPVRVRMIDRVGNDPQFPDTAFVNLRTSFDEEVLMLQETGPDSGVFLGELPSDPFGGSTRNGVVDGLPGEPLTARNLDATTLGEVTAEAVLVGAAVQFVDAQGRPAELYLESSRAYLLVEDHGANFNPGSTQDVSVQVTADVSADQEGVNLTETGPNTGLFGGWIQLRPGPGQPFNGFLETRGVPGQFGLPPVADTLRAAYTNAESFTASDTASMVGSRVWFIDASGAVVTSYAQGARVFVRVEDHGFNRHPDTFDTLFVRLFSEGTGDEEYFHLLETGGDTGVFEGSLPMEASGSAASNNGVLQAQAGSDITAEHQDFQGFSIARARASIDLFSLQFIDDAGRPTAEVLENGTARVRMFNADASFSPAVIDTFSLEVRSRHAADQEILDLTETGPNTHVFEGGIRLFFGPRDLGNARLETLNSGFPQFLPEELTARVGPITATARVTGARVVFIDPFGREVTALPLGVPVQVRVIDHARNNPEVPDTFSLEVRATGSSFDRETVEMGETGFDTGVFEGQVASGPGSSSQGDGVLQGEVGSAVEARHVNTNDPGMSVAHATFTGSALLFLDAEGRPADEVLEGSRVHVRVIDHTTGSPSVGVELTADRTGDREFLVLSRTGSGVFEGSLRLGRESTQGGNQVLETGEDPGPPHRFDTVRGRYEDLHGGVSTASATTVGSRTWFVDAEGAVVASYAWKSRAYVRVENHNFNGDPGQFDSVEVRLFSQSPGDQEFLSLVETGRDTGIFEGSIALSGNGSFHDGLLQADSGSQIHAEHRSFVGFSFSSAEAAIELLSLRFIDEDGRTATEVLENGTARIRVFSAGDNQSPGVADQLGVEVRSRYAGDDEIVDLIETGPDTNVFEGSIGLQFGPRNPGNAILETLSSGPPQHLPEELTARFGPKTAKASTVGSRLWFLDGFGRPTATVPLGAPVRVRLIDHTLDDPQSRDSVSILLRAETDDESLILQETGFDTGIFEEQMATAPGSAIGHDGVLQGDVGIVIEGRHANTNSPRLTIAQAAFTTAAVLFLDAEDRPVSEYLESSTVYVRVIDHTIGGSTVGVELTSELGRDREMLPLNKTTDGVFEGSIRMRVGPGGPNGLLDTGEAIGPPHRFDTLQATYETHSGPVTATAGTLGSRTWFVDAFGTVVTSYAQGSRVYLRVEDHNFNSDPNVFDSLDVQLGSPDDFENLILLETGKNTGVFEGSIALANSGSGNDGRLQALAGSEIFAEHRDFQGQTFSRARATIEAVSIQFIDEAGRPTVEVLENGTARIRVFSTGGNGSPGTADQVGVEVRSRYANDDEIVDLTETGADTNVFEGSIGLEFGPRNPGNTILETLSSGPPQHLPEELTARLGPHAAQARMVSARLFFIDPFGREMTALPLGSPVSVRLIDHTLDDPQSRDAVTIQLLAGTDQESLLLQETGFDTGIFEGRIDSGLGPVSLNNGVLQGVVGSAVEARHANTNNPHITFAHGTFAGSAVLFLDAAGQPVSEVLEASTVYVRVIDHSAPGSTVGVELTADLSGDREMIPLSETTDGVYEGSLRLRLAQSQMSNGFLETREDFGPPHQFDTIRARYETSDGISTASAGTLGSRTWFVDGYGSVVKAYAQGSRVSVRVEDHNANGDPNVFDTLDVQLSSQSDFENLILLETGKNTGLFEGSIALATSGSGNDGRLQALAGSEILAEHRDFEGHTFSRARALVEAVSIQFIDEAGRPTAEVLENGTARIRVFSTDGNSDPGSADQVGVEVRSRFANDDEIVDLIETGADTNVFEGTVDLAFGPGNPGNSILETLSSGPPQYLPEELTARLGPHTAQARTVSSRLVFIDPFGRETTALPLGAPVGVRLIDHTLDDPQSRDSVTIELQSEIDHESLLLQETGFDTGIFEGRIDSGRGPISQNNGVLQGVEASRIEARHANTNNPRVTVGHATFTGGAVLFLDAAGQPVSEYLESSTVYVRVIDHSAPGSTVGVELAADLSGDREMIPLSKTTDGIFEGSIRLRLAQSQVANGFLETQEEFGPPHLFDTIRARYENDGGVSTVSAGTTGSRTWFLDAYGTVVTKYAQGSRVYVRVEDHNADGDSNVFDSLDVQLSSSSPGDFESLILLETGKHTGIFEGSIALANSGSGSDGRLQALAGSEILAEHRDFQGQTFSRARAVIEAASIQFIDEAGRPTAQVLENGTARIRVFNTEANGDPGVADQVGVEVRSRYANDDEIVDLTETGPDTNVFEGSTGLAFGPRNPGNTILETLSSGPPQHLPEELTARLGPHTAQARTVGSHLVFIDQFGRELTALPLGSPVRVRLTDHTLDDPQSRDAVSIQLQSEIDHESLLLQETGFDTGIFEGRIDSGRGPISLNNGVLQGVVGSAVEARHANTNNPHITFAHGTFTGSAVLFLDAAGQPVSAYLESSTAYVRVIDHSAPGSTVGVKLMADLSGDQEMVALNETTDGVYEGSIRLRLAQSQVSNGFLETQEEFGPPHLFDTIRARYEANEGVSTASAGTLGSRTWFLDAFGTVVTTYAQGSRVSVRVEDHNADGDPNVFNSLDVQLSSQSDFENLILLETGKHTGIFEGSIALANSGSGNDGRLQALAGSEILAEHRDFQGHTFSRARATIETVSIQFIDEDGRPTSQVLENGTARIRVFSLDGNSNPGSANQLGIEVLSRYANDDEIVDLTETGPDTNVFEGSIGLAFGPRDPGNTILETSSSGPPQHLPEELTARLGPHTAQARTVGSHLVFIDQFGRELTDLPLGSPVSVRLIDHTLDDPQSRDSVSIQLQSEIDQESLLLQETGFDTGIFEGRIDSGRGPVSLNNGVLQGAVGSAVEARHANTNNPHITFAHGTFTGNAVIFLDAAGQPAREYLESSTAYVRVIDHSAPGSTVGVRLTADLSGDQEMVALNETTDGVYEGSIRLRLAQSQASNGFLETQEEFGPPHLFDTIRAQYETAEWVSTVSAATLGSRTWFLDAYGTVVTTYAQGSRAYVWVEDHNADGDPNVADSLDVHLSSSSPSDFENLILLETGQHTGVFEGSIALATSGTDNDGRLQALPGSEILAEHRDFQGQTFSRARATIETAAIQFIDETGRPTSQVLENGTARIRVFSLDANSDPGSVNQVGVEVRSRSANDDEIVDLTETGPDTNVFEGSIGLAFGPRDPGNLVLETLSSGPPQHLPEELTARLGPFTATAFTVGSRAAFLNLRGHVVTTYSLGSPVRVRLEDHTLNQSPGVAESVSVDLRALESSDRETVSLTETGPDTGIFIGSVLSTEGPTSVHDGVLSAAAGKVVEAVHANTNNPHLTIARATFLSNRSPIAEDDTAETLEEEPVVIAVLANDSDPDSPLPTVASVTQGTDGAVVINPDGTVTYTPEAGFIGTDTFSYILVDDQEGEATANVTVTVIAANLPPQAEDDEETTPEDQAVVIEVLANDLDPDSDPLEVVSVTQPTAGGSVVINPDFTLTFTPTPNFSGTGVTFTYTISDPEGLEDTATVSIDVTPVNDAPVANDDTATVAEDGSVNVPVLANDTDLESDTLNVTSVTQGTNGSVVINPDKTVVYTSAANFNGSDSFTYTTSDGNGGSDTATVSVTVTAVNDAPVANDDTATVAEDGSVNVAVLANDTDPENDTLNVTSVTQGTNGSVVINPDKTAAYTPAANFNGSDSFTYTISDGNGGSDTATVNVTVTAVNDAPVANADTTTVAEDGSVVVTILANDSDPESNRLDISSVTQGAHGAVVINPDKTVTYTPAANYNGPDSFTYTINDGNGGTATASVSVTVTAVNDAPVAVNDTASVQAGSAVTIPVRANDVDIDSPSLTITSVTQGARGTVTINSGQTVTYTAGLFAGLDDTFTYTVSDGAGGTATATVTVSLQTPARVSSGLQVLYRFEEGSGSIVNDVSGVGTPINLTINNMSAVSWISGGLAVNNSTILSSGVNATKVINAAKASNAITIEAWIRPRNLTQTGPSAVFKLEKTNSQRNFLFGQTAARYETRTSTSGGTRNLQSPANSANLNLTHVVYTRNSSGVAVYYINGTQVSTATATGNLSNWANDHRLAIADSWRGDLFLASFYSNALSANEVKQNFLAGQNGN